MSGQRHGRLNVFGVDIEIVRVAPVRRLMEVLRHFEIARIVGRADRLGQRPRVMTELLLLLLLLYGLERARLPAEKITQRCVGRARRIVIVIDVSVGIIALTYRWSR